MKWRVLGAPAVVGGDHQGVAHTGSSEAAAQLVEQAVEQRLQWQHQQQRADKEFVERLQKKKISLFISISNTTRNSSWDVWEGSQSCSSFSCQDWKHFQDHNDRVHYVSISEMLNLHQAVV